MSPKNSSKCRIILFITLSSYDFSSPRRLLLLLDAYCLSSLRNGYIQITSLQQALERYSDDCGGSTKVVGTENLVKLAKSSVLSLFSE